VGLNPCSQKKFRNRKCPCLIFLIDELTFVAFNQENSQGHSALVIAYRDSLDGLIVERL
jgi:hypothetical protein